MIQARLRRQTLYSLPTHEVRNNDLITAKNRMVVSCWREEELGGGDVTIRNKVGLCYVNRETTKSDNIKYSLEAKRSLKFFTLQGKINV